jgi:ATP-dependent RNA helicase DDX5/DBP2
MSALGLGLQDIDWSKVDLVPFRKNFYVPHEEVVAMSEKEIDEIRKEHDLRVEGEDIPRPITKFEHSGFPEYLLKELRKAGFAGPTSIQSQGWPMALTGKDLIAVAETGSGKTLAFLLPAILHINAQPTLSHGDGPVALVLCPTRELALQIQQEVDKFGFSSKLRHTCVYGGVPKGPQVSALRRGVEILIATPGRLIDMLEGGYTNLRRVTYLVLDEADRMLDMGFEPQMKQIVSQIRPDRQTLLWSATWPKEVRQIAAEFTQNPLKITVGSDDLTANPRVTQHIECVAPYEKMQRLKDILADTKGKTLIFTGTKYAADDLANELSANGIRAAAIHGDKSQNARDYILRQFKSGAVPVMIATDVASRGLDVKDITKVINFDFPKAIEDYIHRIGRTGRAGNFGDAYSFFCPEDAKKAKELIRVLKEANQVVPQKLSDYAYRMGGSSNWSGRYGGGRSGGSGRNGGGRGGRSGGYNFRDRLGY